jgi:hypothetical protein
MFHYSSQYPPGDFCFSAAFVDLFWSHSKAPYHTPHSLIELRGSLTLTKPAGPYLEKYKLQIGVRLDLQRTPEVGLRASILIPVYQEGAMDGRSLYLGNSRECVAQGKMEQLR